MSDNSGWTLVDEDDTRRTLTRPTDGGGYLVLVEYLSQSGSVKDATMVHVPAGKRLS